MYAVKVYFLQMAAPLNSHSRHQQKYKYGTLLLKCDDVYEYL